MIPIAFAGTVRHRIPAKEASKEAADIPAALSISIRLQRQRFALYELLWFWQC